MNENEMGYRGSKSKFLNPQPKKNFVKEQRVDGSYFGFYPKLRCTLTGFERNYQIKILSKQINKLRSYSIAIPQSQTMYSCLNPNFITGFIDAEWSFIVRVRKNPNSKIG